jgi:hypothetical protein
MKHTKPSELAEKFSVSLRSLRKSGRVLYAFSQFYLPFYNCDLRILLFDHWDVFGCLSAGVYEVDEMIEAGVPTADVFRALTKLRHYLEGRVECDEYIRKRFDDARRYYSFEASLLQGTEPYSFDKLIAITEIRSFDFRILHRALTRLTGRAYDLRVFQWFQWFEMLMEIEDDLLSSSEDMDRGTYNIFCLAARLSGDSATTLVADLRRRIEWHLEECSRDFHETQRAACSSIYATYRKIVPRLEVPSLCTEFPKVGGAEIAVPIPRQKTQTRPI